MSDIVSKPSIKMWPEDERPREKALRHGISTLTKPELLAILVGSGSPNVSAVELMKTVLQSCGNSISELSKLSVDDLRCFKGIGEAKALTIMAACELWKRRAGEELNGPVCITSSEDLYNYFHPIMCDCTIERCYVLLMNSRNRVIDHVLISSGGFTSTPVDVRVVIREALMKKATAIALCHNHPSGNVKPSRDDDNLTKNLQEACRVMNIRMLDHIVITDGAYFSYCDELRF